MKSLPQVKRPIDVRQRRVLLGPGRLLLVQLQEVGAAQHLDELVRRW